MTDIARLYPCFLYHDPEAACAWLTDVVGFVPVARHHDAAGRLVHAELALGASLLMLGAVRDDAFGARAGLPAPGPAAQGGKCLYLAVPEVDALFARVAQSGVAILETPADRTYGSREFLCSDPEGNLFSFGTYAPVPPAA